MCFQFFQCVSCTLRTGHIGGTLEKAAESPMCCNVQCVIMCLNAFQCVFSPNVLQCVSMFFQCVSRTLRISGLEILAVANLLNRSLLLVNSFEYCVSVLRISTRSPPLSHIDKQWQALRSGKTAWRRWTAGRRQWPDWPTAPLDVANRIRVIKSIVREERRCAIRCNVSQCVTMCHHAHANTLKHIETHFRVVL